MLVVVEYGMGNVGSVLNMLKRVGADPVLTAEPARIAAASKIILSGVGAFDTGMRRLSEEGLVDVLGDAALRRGVPILGLCLGMHLLMAGSEEGQLPGLGWVAGRTVRFRFDGAQVALKVPHMGWNTVEVRRGASIVRGLPLDARFYFVHSYHVVCERDDDVAATTEYGYSFPSIIEHGNIMGTQFHPEKSHRFGMRFLERFVTLS